MGATATAYVRHHDTGFGALLALVADELSNAQVKFGPMVSAHEGYAVILEELDELWQHVKVGDGETTPALFEAVQVAAMALRYVLDLGSPLSLYSLRNDD